MNAQTAKDYLPLVQALAEGKTLQCCINYPVGSKWIDAPELCDKYPASDYRIKPEPRKFMVVVDRRTKIPTAVYSPQEWNTGHEDGSMFECVEVVEVIK